MNIKLFAPKGFFLLTPDEKKIICNGTGSSGTPKCITKILDNLYGFGFNYKLASEPHDYMYFVGESIGYKLLADFVYFLNLMILFLYNLFKTLIFLATIKLNLLRVFLYPIAVFLFGWKAYFKNKKESV